MVPYGHLILGEEKEVPHSNGVCIYILSMQIHEIVYLPHLLWRIAYSRAAHKMVGIGPRNRAN